MSSRTWGIILPSEWPNTQAIIDFSKTLGKYYIIEHNQDFDSETGEIKKPHWHCLITFSSPRKLSTLETLYQDFNELKSNSFEKIRNANGAKRYLVHKDNPEKHQYPHDAVQTNDPTYKDALRDKISNEDELDELVSLMHFNQTGLAEMFEQWKPFLLRLNSYQRFIALMRLRREWIHENTLPKEPRHEEHCRSH